LKRIAAKAAFIRDQGRGELTQADEAGDAESIDFVGLGPADPGLGEGARDQRIEHRAVIAHAIAISREDEEEIKSDPAQAHPRQVILPQQPMIDPSEGPPDGSDTGGLRNGFRSSQRDLWTHIDPRRCYV